MRKLVVLAVLAVLAVAVTTSVSAGPGPVGSMYEFHAAKGGGGLLHIAFGEGQRFAAFDSHGHLVMEGLVDGDYCIVPCPNSGPDRDGNILRIVLEQGSFFTFNVEDPSDWMWD